MPIEVKIPSPGESITQVQIGKWLKREGDAVVVDEPIVEIDSDKVSIEVLAPSAGVIAKALKPTGAAAQVGDVIAVLDDKAQPTGKGKAPTAKVAPVMPPASAPVMPAARRVMAEKGLSEADVKGSGPGGRVLKADALAAQPATSETRATERMVAKAAPVAAVVAGARAEDVIPMTPLRRRLAERLVQSQHTAAILSTFNEIDMSAVMELRKQHKESFSAKFGVGLGFMSFFVKAAVDALKLVPAVNAEIRGNDIVYHNYMDIAVAVGGGKGLVTPVLRNAERMSFAEIELAIKDFGTRAKDNKLKLEELQGGTFTISNGGVYGSLLSTPIINPPQSGILGMHAINERPIAVNGAVVVRPMMYVALSYDHRLIDGREAVTFLKRIKEVMENPARMLLEV